MKGLLCRILQQAHDPTEPVAQANFMRTIIDAAT